MTRRTLLIRGLIYHGRGNLAVLLAAAVGTAVLAGALLVGDSLRGSLRQRAADQLNGIDRALIAPKFFREAVARETGGVPALLLQGNVAVEGNPLNRVAKVTVLGVDHLLTDQEPLMGVTLSQPLAQRLALLEGNRILLSVQKASALPRSSVLGRRGTSDSVQTIALTVARILPADHPGNVFQLNPSPGVPLNLYVPLNQLQAAIGQVDRINAVFAMGENGPSAAAKLPAALTLEDWGLTVGVAPKRKAYIEVESRRLVLEPAVVAAVGRTAKEMNLRAAETFVYLANGIRDGKTSIPYSVVAGLNPSLAEPLGPFLPPNLSTLKDDEIVLADWKPSPLKAKAGDSINIDYFEPEIEGDVKTASKPFKLVGTIPLEGVANDPDLTPAFPGITDKLSLSNWDPPFPYDPSRVKASDEDYWKRYKTTPKAYITLNAARKMFGSRFGDTTSIRIAPAAGQTPEETLKAFAAKLRDNLNPESGGFTFEAIRERLATASSGSNDFGMLFLGFSFFLIAAALMLVGLMFRLNVERRAKEFGLLMAVGYAPKTIRGMLLREGLILAIVGSLLGLLGAVGFAGGMLQILKALWPDETVRSFLQLNVVPLSLIIGFVSSVLTSLACVYWAVRSLKRVPAPLLLKGATEEVDGLQSPRNSRWVPFAIAIALFAGVGCLFLAPTLPAGEARAGAFFGGGSCLLMFLLGALWLRLRRRRSAVNSIGTLARAGRQRNPKRSLLTAALLASAAFLLVAVESFRREPESDFASKTGGSGGFGQILELDSPLFVAPGTAEFADMIADALRRNLQAQKIPGAEISERLKGIDTEWAKPNIYLFRVRAGDDASCLNLFQSTNPRVLSPNRAFLERGGFAFAEHLGTDENPWMLLNGGDGGAPEPVFTEENTAQWMLKIGLGETFEILDGNGQPFKVQLAGTLKDSPFQSEIVMGEDAFKRHFPRQEGSNWFLLDMPEKQRGELLIGLGDYGPTISSTRDRVANYLAVQNTYLTTFQLLGGLGLLLGVLGLAAVLLRNILERRGELALLAALGYSPKTIRRLVNAENVGLFATGLIIGVGSALISILPAAKIADIPWLRLGVLLAAVFALGMLVIRLAIRFTLRQQIVAGLRSE